MLYGPLTDRITERASARLDAVLEADAPETCWARIGVTPEAQSPPGRPEGLFRAQMVVSRGGFEPPTN